MLKKEQNQLTGGYVALFRAMVQTRADLQEAMRRVRLTYTRIAEEILDAKAEIVDVKGCAQVNMETLRLEIERVDSEAARLRKECLEQRKECLQQRDLESMHRHKMCTMGRDNEHLQKINKYLRKERDAALHMITKMKKENEVIRAENRALHVRLVSATHTGDYKPRPPQSSIRKR